MSRPVVRALVSVRLLVAAGSLLAAPAVSAPLPTGGAVEAGSAFLAQGANSLTVHQSSDRLRMSWDSFNIAAGHSVEFRQPSSSSLAVNLVRGGDASVIAGNLSANGRVVLVNPQGVAFTGSAQVNVGSLVASALRDADGAFADGRTVLSGPGGDVSNAGVITVSRGGSAVLAGARVTNTGHILADAGKVALAAGGKVSLDFSGDGLISVAVDEGALNAEVANGGAIRVGSGHILLTAKSAEALASSVVRNSGELQASGIVERGGEIWLTADVVESSGTVTAASEAGQGGEAHLVGRKSVAVTGTVDVSGGVKGGFVDVSAPAVLLPSIFQIQVGRGGKFLLDPDNITVAASGDAVTASPTTPAPGTDLTLHAADIETWLNGGSDLTLQTTAAGTITVNKSITATGAGSLSLVTANGDININKAIDLAGNLTLTAGGTGVILVDGAIDAAAFSVTTVGGSILTKHAINAAGAVSLLAGGASALTVDGTIDSASFTGTSAGGAVLVKHAITTTGNLTLSTAGLGTLTADAALSGAAISASTQAGALQVNHNVTATGAISLASTTGSITTLATSTLTGVGVSANSAGGDITTFGTTTATTGNLTLSTTGAGEIAAVGTLAGADISATTVDGFLFLYAPVNATGSLALSVTGAGNVGTTVGGTLTVGTALSVSATTGFTLFEDTVTAGGVISLSSTNGDIIADSTLTGAGVSITSTGGDLDIDTVNAGAGALTLSTAGAGAIIANSTLAGANVSATTVDGDLDLLDTVTASGALTLASGSGTVTVDAAALGATLAVTTGTGDLVVGADMDTTVGGILLNVGGDIVFTQALTEITSATGFTYSLAGKLLTNRSQAAGGARFAAFRNATELAVAGWLIAEDLAGPNGFSLAGDVRVQYGLTGGVPTASDLTFVPDLPGFKNVEPPLVGYRGSDTFASAFVAPNRAFSWDATAPSASSPAGSTFAYTASLGAGFSILKPGYVVVAMQTRGVLTVAPRSLLVRPDDVSLTYGDATPSRYAYQVTGFLPPDSLATVGLTGEALTRSDYDSANPAFRGAGTYDISISQNTHALPSGSNYALVYEKGVLTVDRAPLSLKAKDLTREYGEANPTLLAEAVDPAQYKYTDTLGSALTGTLALGTTAGLASDVGDYAITLGAGTALAANYTLSYADGTLTVTKAPLTVTLLDATKVYGDPLAATYPYVMDGFRNGQTEAGLRVAGTLSGSVQFTSTATQSSTVGVYAITPTSGSLTARNYAFTTFESADLTVTKRSLTVSAAPSREYGLSNDPANITFNVNVTGWAAVNGDSQASRLSGTPGISGAPAITANVGVYPVTISQGTLDAGPNYDISVPAATYVNPANFTVTKATSLRFVADDKTREYGDANPTLTYTVSGFRNGDTAAVLGGIPAISTTATALSNVGDYTITIGSGALFAANYTVNLPANFVNGTLSVTKATLQVTANDKARSYGAANPPLDYSVTGFKNGQNLASSGVTGLAELSTDAVAASPVGDYDIVTAIGTLASGNYDFELYDGVLTIGKAPLSIQVDAASNEYGSDFAGFTLTLVGLQNGETQDALRTAGALSGDAVYSYTRAQVKALGVAGSPYAVSITGLGTLAADNYSFLLPTPPAGNGQLTITKAPLSVIASDKTRLYGDANPSLEYSFSGFKFGEATLAAIGATGLPTLSTEATLLSSVGDYEVTVDIGAMSSANYSFTPVNGTITIAKAPLTLKVDDATSEYGSDFAGFTLTMTGFKNGQTQAGLRTAGTLSGDATYTYANSAVKLLDVSGSPYAVAATSIGTLDAQNYSFSVQTPPAGTGQLTITPAPITLKATAITRTYGEASTQLQVDDKWDIVGLKNGQTRDGLIAAGVIASGPTVSSPLATDALTNAGTYTGAVTVSPAGFAFAGTPNYSLDPLAATAAADLTVDKAAVVVGVLGSPLTKVYGAAVPTLTPSYSGFKNGQDATTAGFVGSAALSTVATPSSNVGSYAITVDISGISAGNYTFTKVDGVLDITKAPLTVSADAKTRQYGLSNPTLTATLTGFVLGQTLGTSGVTGSAALSTTATPTSSVAGSPYPITVGLGTLASSNYDFVTFNDSTLTITRAPLTIVADAKTKVYGDANPTLTYTVSGLRQADTDAVILGGTPTVSTTVTQLTGAGTYVGAITADITGLSADNYTIGATSGTFTVQKATLVGKVDDTVRSYGYPNPAFTVTWTGYKNGDAAATAGFTGAIAFSTDANPASPVAGSPYTVTATPGTYASPNYAFGAIDPGILTVDRGNLWENEFYNLAAAPLAAAIRLEDIQSRLRGLPLTRDPQASIDFDKFSVRLSITPPSGEKDKKKPDAAKPAEGSVSKN